MRKVRKIKLKPWLVKVFKIIGIFLCILIGIFIYYIKQIHDLNKIGYSEIASKNILFSKNKDYVLSIGENKTLNKAFESNSINFDYLDNYAKIKFVNHKDLIKNINKLLEQGYSNSEINIILSHGSNDGVSEFAKKKKVRYLEDFYSYDFAKIENYDKYISYSDETGEDELETIIYINLGLDKEDYVDSKLVSKFSTDMIVNKQNYLSKDFEPDDLTLIDSKYTNGEELYCSRLAYNAFIQMYNAAKGEGYDLVINSAYRSYQDQEDTVQLYKDLYGDSYVEKYVAKPGYSEHQTGLAFDVGSANSRVFANSKEYVWMKDNAYKYGFILRFDERYVDYTRFRAEPWHYRYVGTEIAKYVYEHNNMSLEEYYVMFLDK